MCTLYVTKYPHNKLLDLSSEIVNDRANILRCYNTSQFTQGDVKLASRHRSINVLRMFCRLEIKGALRALRVALSQLE